MEELYTSDAIFTKKLSFPNVECCRHQPGKKSRGPISKKRNKHLQAVLIEAAKLAPHWNPQLVLIHERELKKGSRNRATLAVARKFVIYMLAVEKTRIDFVIADEADAA